MADDPGDKTCVTVLDELVDVYDYRLKQNCTRTWKLLQYPLNEFKLEYRKNADSSVISYFNLDIIGPPISNVTVKIKKEGYNPIVRNLAGGYTENKEIVVNGEETFDWNFSTGYPPYSTTINGLTVYVFHLWLKIECSFPTFQQPILNSGENVNVHLNNVSEFFNDPSYGDFKVEVDNEIFSVSKIVLAVGSPIFKTMFASPLSESKENCLKIGDFSSSTIKKLLQFLYDSETPLEDDLEQAELLVAAADKYQINKLKERCEQIILKNLNIENAARLVIFADRHQCALLRQACIVLICTNYAEFIKTEDCEKLHKDFTKLAIEISGAAAQYKR